MMYLTKAKRSTLVLIIVLFFTACDRIELNLIPADGIILAFGDSLTVGVGTKKSKSYPSVLAELSGRKVINAGVSGETTTKGLERLRHILANTNVSLLILLEGGNDILRNQNLKETKNNLAHMIEIAQSYGIDVVLVGVPENKLFSDVAPFYEELAQEYTLVYEADVISDLLWQPKYKSDAIHFNTEGYRQLALSLHALLVKHGALE